MRSAKRLSGLVMVFGVNSGRPFFYSSVATSSCATCARSALPTADTSVRDLVPWREKVWIGFEVSTWLTKMTSPSSAIAGSSPRPEGANRGGRPHIGPEGGNLNKTLKDLGNRSRHRSRSASAGLHRQNPAEDARRVLDRASRSRHAYRPRVRRSRYDFRQQDLDEGI